MIPPADHRGQRAKYRIFTASTFKMQERHPPPKFSDAAAHLW
jgi:hypothetical protein